MKRLLSTCLFCVLISSAGIGQVLLIEDQSGFGALKSVLEGEGYTVTEVNGEYVNGYANLLNGAFIDDFELIVYGERGEGFATPMTLAVRDSLEAYIQAGGHLVVTGYDSLFGDVELANLVRAVPSGDQVSFNITWGITDEVDHAILNGPYGDFRGQSFEATGYDDDRLTADVSRGAMELVATGEPRITGKIIYTDVGDGSVIYWNGGNSGTPANAQPDFSDGGHPQSIFLNLVYDAVALVADAGSADSVFADYDGDGLVTLNLDASTSRGGGGIVSWQWMWPGGGALGETASVTFPADGVNRAILLTVTDVFGDTAQDQFHFKPIISPSLYADLSAPDNPGFASQGAVVFGETIVVGCGAGNDIEVFRKESGVWVRYSLTAYGPDVHIVDEDTILSLDLSGTMEPTVYRYASGVWGSSVITIAPAFTGSSAVKTIATDGQTVVIGDSMHLVPSFGGNLFDGGKACVYEWTGNQWTLAFERAGVYDDYEARVGYHVNVEAGAVVIGHEVHSGEWEGISELYKEIDGEWTLVELVSDFGGDGEFEGFSAYWENGVLLTGFQTGQRFAPGYPVFVVYEKLFQAESVWTLTKSFKYTRSDEFEAFSLDSDGGSFVIDYAKRESGDEGAYIEVHQKLNPEGSWLEGADIRRLSSVDLEGLNAPSLAGLSNGLLLISDTQAGLVRVFDTRGDWGLLNVEPIADAGDDLYLFSLDRLALPVLLNSDQSIEVDALQALFAEWSWLGGSATGQQAAVLLEPGIHLVTLRLTDSAGAISRDTVTVTVDVPTGYNQWKSAHSISDDREDGDRDGNEAIIEYAVDGDPQVPDYRAPVLPVSSPSQNTYAEFDVYVSATADAIRYDVKAADTLEDLINGTNADTIASFSQADGSSGYLRVIDIQPMANSSTRFARVEVVYDPSLSIP